MPPGHRHYLKFTSRKNTVEKNFNFKKTIVRILSLMTILIGYRSADTELGTVVTPGQSEAELGLSDQ